MGSGFGNLCVRFETLSPLPPLLPQSLPPSPLIFSLLSPLSFLLFPPFSVFLSYPPSSSFSLLLFPLSLPLQTVESGISSHTPSVASLNAAGEKLIGSSSTENTAEIQEDLKGLNER